MNCTFVVGQRVVCIYAGLWTRVDVPVPYLRDGPKVGDIVKITKIIPSNFVCNRTGVPVCGLNLAEWPGDEGYVHTNFRPLNNRPTETSIEVFKKLLTPTKITERA